MTIIVALIIALGLALALWRVARRRRIERLASGMQLPNAAAVAHIANAARVEAAHPLQGAALEGAAITALAIPVQALWELSQIDPLVIKAVSSASSHASGMPDVSADYMGFLGYVADNIDRLGEPGGISRMQGYVSEQRVFEILRDQGHLVEAAPLPNTAGWDALVDGRAVNVKSYADISAVNSKALANPQYEYFVNEDALGTPAADNVTVVEGFSRTESLDALQTSLEAGEALVTGAFAADAALGGVPVMLVALSLFRETRAVRRGEKHPEAALVDAALSIGVQGTSMAAGVFLGAKAGAAAGLLIDGAAMGSTAGSSAVIGGVVGALGGGIAGSTTGRKVVKEIRTAPLRSAEQNLHRALLNLGQAAISDGALTRLRTHAQLPLQRAEVTREALSMEAQAITSTWRWAVWPSSGQVLVVETARAAGAATESVARATADAERSLNAIESCANPPLAVGLMMANEPDLRAAVGCPELELGDVRVALLTVERVRRDQDRPLSRSETFRAARRTIRDWLS